MSTVSPLARELRRLRAEKGLPMRALASQAEVSTKTISLIETGKQHPSALTIAKLARGLGVPAGHLLGLEDVPAAPKAREPQPFDAWGAAVAEARRVRADGRESMDGMLTAWRGAKAAGNARAVRKHLDAIGELLQDAYDAERALWGAGGVAPTDEWISEAQEASRTYGALVEQALGAGLGVKQETLDDKQARARIKVEELAAA